MIDICFSRSDAGVLGAILNTKEETGEIAGATGLETKGLHSLRHTFATNLVNGIK